MNFYEELGLTRTASIEEIRQAYKNLARLVHPDQCADEKLRALAELQMKRLNQILAVLADPAERRKYDAALDLPGVAPPRPLIRARLGKDPAAWVWLGTAAIAVVGMVCFFASTADGPALPERRRDAAGQGTEAVPPPRQAPQAVSGPVKEPAAAQAARVSPPPLKRKPVLAPPPAAARAAAPVPLDPAPAGYVKPVQANPVPAAGVLESLSSVPPPPPPAVHGLAGNWFYIPAARAPKSNGVYPPEYIELRVTEDAGTMRGRYRARYKVTDQAISPEVSFQFQCARGESPAGLPWTGPGGARGELTLKQVSEAALEVSWRAYRLSAELGLASGTATLVREQDR